MPRVINDSPLDDRDAGIVSLGGDSLLVTWFTTNRGPDYESVMRKRVAEMDAQERARWLATVGPITPDIERRFTGSWGLVSEDGGASFIPVGRIPVSAPHGCIRLRNGTLLYLGKLFEKYKAGEDLRSSPIMAAQSRDNGRTWELLGEVPPAEGLYNSNCHEPHVVELPSGRLLGAIRVQNSTQCNVTELGYISFSMFITASDDGGRTWTQMQYLGFHGAPPHLVQHSSGTLVLTYGYRVSPFGQRVAFSLDGGATWDHDWVLRDDGPDIDLGYPSTVELPDGSLFTVYYQKPNTENDKCALLWSHWSLPSRAI